MRDTRYNRAKLAWLRANPALWRGIEFHKHSDSTRILVDQMRVAGLYAETTVWTDTNVADAVWRLQDEEAARAAVATGVFAPHSIDR